MEMGKRPSSSPVTNATGNSSPLDACNVISVTRASSSISSRSVRSAISCRNVLSVRSSGLSATYSAMAPINSCTFCQRARLSSGVPSCWSWRARPVASVRERAMSSAGAPSSTCRMCWRIISRNATTARSPCGGSPASAACSIASQTVHCRSSAKAASHSNVLAPMPRAG